MGSLIPQNFIITESLVPLNFIITQSLIIFQNSNIVVFIYLLTFELICVYHQRKSWPFWWIIDES